MAHDSLSEPVLKIFHESLKHENFTPVQHASIPKLLSHCDVAVEACTGSGKTLAFVMPVIELLKRSVEDGDLNKGVGIWGSLIVSPTRELASQTFKIVKMFTEALGMKALQLTGGTKADKSDSVGENVKASISEVWHVVVGTPGRIVDVMERAGGRLVLKHLVALILDEADVLLDLGFERSLSSILQKLPKQRRTGLFSATQTSQVQALIRAGLRNPVVIKVQVENSVQDENGTAEKSITPTTLENYYLDVEPDEKLSVLAKFLASHQDCKTVVFFATRASVDFFGKMIPMVCTKALTFKSLHGGMPQQKRDTIYADFVAAESGVLLCTDVAARGVDIPDVDWIVQFDPPQDLNYFVHRVGRTARAGKSGRALVLIHPKEIAYIHLLRNKKVPFEESPESWKTDLKATAILEKGKAEVFKDRDLLEKGTKAFIAYVRSYREHKCQHIFRLKALDLLKVAQSFMLLRLPNLSELRETKGIKGFKEVPAAQVSAIRFRDKAREKQRQSKLEAERIENEKREAEKSQKKKQHEEEKKRKQQEAEQGAEVEQTRKRRKQGLQKQIFDEWDALGRDELLYKKYKKGKLSKAAYEKALEDLEAEEFKKSCK